jgi:SNF2 family DNA or RNA helicase
VVLDEAQAIKNPSTRRFQAAMQLRADFRLATTGTPVENHLEELWTLFRFLNPGLLGSRQRFRHHFMETPGQRDLLKKLVRPFLLRRTKSQVLKELPPRTDLVLEVELTAAERALYEAIRLRAVEELSEEGAEPLAVLAELMRLRRACCHPRLVLGDDAPPEVGSKLEVLHDLLSEMQAGGHRALIFSQFVDHLQLVRESLERQGLTYQYLDGGTPTAERTRRIAAFQGGVGAVFLISLKAGGVGLNLTAADYVIHLDPWWNPAVEDQASDRAHRIGQMRPVTVYRLVAKDTVEERILELHRSKRELAETLLDGAATALPMSADELLRLLKT